MENKMTLLESRLKNLLLYSDGSTTRLLSLLTGREISVTLHYQENLPFEECRGFKNIINLFPSHFSFCAQPDYLLCRLTSLHHENTLLSENLVFGCTNFLSSTLLEGLEQGEIPLGYLLSHLEYRREWLWQGEKDSAELQNLFHPRSLPSKTYPVKHYLITRQGKPLFYICELFHLHQITEYFCNSDTFEQEGVDGIGSKKSC
ncbi:DUF98 domain-containing protein [Heliorestis acidaminivorans]|uniref:DUF98 domain-containing protein n=1 Tax=Heliorestis acidaminivorans TaxID=553427 RepID=A0A6I0EQE8_9FIRM|nr:DUF98 domain-containing protein [Heliorestis acidaminivorans]